MITAAILVCAVLAAARSTWSPCGLSMLSTITPFGERARGHRYGATAAWFIAGAVAGGLTLGGVCSLLTIGLGRGPLAVGSVLALCGAAVDAGAFGPVLPLIRRQVDDRWVARYRPWFYAAGFGWQVGVGVATYLMTAAVGVVAGLAVLSGSWPTALLAGGVFGLARGLTVLLTAAASTPSALRALHRRLDRLGPAVRWALVGAQAAAGVALDPVAAGWAAGGIAFCAAGMLLWGRAGALRRRAGIFRGRPAR